MNTIVFFYLIVGVTQAYNREHSRTNGDCDYLGILLYEDLGCEPRYDIGPCPSSFKCKFFDDKNETCYFRGKEYNVSDKIETSLITENCFYDCKCANPATSEEFKCKIMRCPNWDEELEEKTKCRRKFDVDKCCAVGQTCLDDKTPQVECRIDEQVYLEGDIFNPYKVCANCACRKGFRGIVEEPFCKRNLCATQIQYVWQLELKCAPFYVLPDMQHTAMCCPDNWVCPEKDDKIKYIYSNLFNRPWTCKFGDKDVQIGYGLIKSFNHRGLEVETICICVIPPLMHCMPVR